QLASALSGAGAGVTATANNATIHITATATGSYTDYGLSYGCTGSCDISVSTGAPSSLTGGKNAIGDSGTVSLTVGSFPVSYSYSSSDTATSIASALA